MLARQGEGDVQPLVEIPPAVRGSLHRRHEQEVIILGLGEDEVRRIEPVEHVAVAPPAAGQGAGDEHPARRHRTSGVPGRMLRLDPWTFAGFQVVQHVGALDRLRDPPDPLGERRVHTFEEVADLVSQLRQPASDQVVDALRRTGRVGPHGEARALATLGGIAMLRGQQHAHGEARLRPPRSRSRSRSGQPGAGS